MKNLNELFLQCKKELDEINIPYGKVEKIVINTRAKKRWGKCSYYKRAVTWEESTFKIEICSVLLNDNVDDNTCKSTIIHELLHTCKCGLTHKGKWKEYAEVVNMAYPQYNIKRTTSAKEKGIEKKGTYTVLCTNCGYSEERYRKTKLITYPEHYRCGKCQIPNTLKVIKN